MDSVDKEKRSRMMGAVKGKNTKPELIVRSYLHKVGFRFRLYRKELPGSPDLVLPKYKTVIFVHGCFWHRHPGCKRTTTPKTRTEFWEAKFRDNSERDKRKNRELEELGWKVIVIWECETEQIEKLEDIISAIKGDNNGTRNT